MLQAFQTMTESKSAHFSWLARWTMVGFAEIWCKIAPGHVLILQNTLKLSQMQDKSDV